MLRELVALLPESLCECSLGVTLIGAVLGAAFWLAGARFSRSLITLLGVAIGTSVGVRLPAWLGWGIDGMAIGVGGAVLLGVSGYLLHRTWSGVYLSVLLALWAVAGSWIALTHSQTAIRLSVDWKTGIIAAVESMWNQLPATLSHMIAMAAGVGLITGMIMTIFLPRLSRVTTWSLAGITLLVSMLGAAEQATHSDWISAIKLNDSVQASALVGLVVLGAAIQWGLLPRAQQCATAARPLPMDD